MIWIYVETVRQKSETREAAAAAAYEAHPALESVAAALTSWHWAHLLSRVVAATSTWQLAPFEQYEQNITQI